MKSVCFVKIVYSNKFPMMSSRSKKDEVLHEPKAGFKKFHKDYGTYFMSFFADYCPFYNEVY